MEWKVINVVRIPFANAPPCSADDPMRPTWRGYDPRRSDAELWDANRGLWKVDPARARSCEYAAFQHGGSVVMVAEIAGVERVPDGGGYAGRSRFIGRVVEGHPLVGTPAPRSYGGIIYDTV